MSRFSTSTPESSASQAPALPWHTDRTRIAELGAALAGAAGVAAKIALDVILLAQTEVGEVAEGDGGRSSTMPQKRNPARSALARASARLAGAHASVLTGGLEHEHERAAGAWQAEWDALSGSLAYAGGALSAVADALESLEVDTDRMRRNLDATGGLALAERISFLLPERLSRSEAQEIVSGAAARTAVSGTSFRDELLADPRTGLDPSELEAALDPAGYLGSAGALVDRALSLYEAVPRAERGRCVRLHHRVDGAADAPPLVLSPSLGTTHAMWDPQVPALSARFRLVRYDRRGHGRSPVPDGPYSLDDLGGDVLDLLDELSLERVSFCGLSIGGMVGMWLAVNVPERIDRLVLCCTASALPPREHWLKRAAIVRDGGVAAVADAVARAVVPARRPGAARGAVPDSCSSRHPRRATRGVARRLPRSISATAWARSGAPTLVLSGEADSVAPPERGDELAAGIPDARHVTLGDTGHIANAEQPEQFTKHVLAHLTEETR